MEGQVAWCDWAREEAGALRKEAGGGAERALRGTRLLDCAAAVNGVAREARETSIDGTPAWAMGADDCCAKDCGCWMRERTGAAALGGLLLQALAACCDVCQNCVHMMLGLRCLCAWNHRGITRL